MQENLFVHIYSKYQPECAIGEFNQKKRKKKWEHDKIPDERCLEMYAFTIGELSMAYRNVH